MSKLGTKLEFSLKIYQKNNNQFKDAFMSFRSVSSDISNCIVLKLFCAKFQVSKSIKCWSYGYMNLYQSFWITLYLLFIYPCSQILRTKYPKLEDYLTKKFLPKHYLSLIMCQKKWEHVRYEYKWYKTLARTSDA